MKRVLPLLSAAWWLAASAVFTPAEAGAPGVVTTIRPLQLIASAITDEVSEPELLIPPNASYHHSTLRPSSMRSLTGATTVIWIGPGLETWLSDVIRQLPRHVEVITVSEMEGVTRLPLVEDAVISAPDRNREQMDPHLWLDRDNALLVARAVAGQLVERDPANAQRYRDNLARFETSLDRAHARQRARLEPLADREYVVYHNAFQYFERQHGLSPELVFVQDDEIQPGIRQLRMVQQRLRDLSPACLLLDTTANPDTIRTIVGERPLPQVRADTVGARVSPGPDAYVSLLDSITDSFEQCLSGGGQGQVP